MASPRLNQNLSDPLQIGQSTAFRLCWQSGADGPSSWGSAAVDCGDHSRTTADRHRNHSRTGTARRTAVTVAAVSVAVLSVAQPATAKTYEDRIRTAPVDWRYASALAAYTGNSYSVSTVNSLWPRFPRHQRAQRAAMIAAGRKYGVPLRLLMGVYGMESGFGRYRCYFGLTGYFPGVGTSGSFNRDAMLSAGIFRRLLGRHMVR